MMEEEQPNSPQELWNIYVKDQMDWLASHYQKTNVDAYPKKLEEIQKLFKQLKGKISQSKLNKEGEYFNKFASLQKDKYHKMKSEQNRMLTKSIDKSSAQSYLELINQSKIHRTQKLKEKERPESIQEKEQKQNETINNGESQQESKTLEQSQTSQQFHSQYTKMLHQNHMEFIVYLTEQRFTFQNIARHIFRQKNSEEKYFKFVVEKGICFGEGKDYYLINNRLLFYVFMRDLASAIDQLQQQGIFHADIAMRNILLFNCTILQLKDQQKLRKIGDKIKFKLIDFGFAFFLKGQDKIKLTSNIIKKRLNKQCKLQNDPFALFIKQKQDIKRILNQQSYHKQLHSAAFLGLINAIVEKNFQKDGDNEKNPKRPIISNQQFSYIDTLIKQKNYKKIIAEMNMLIKEEMNK